jgi:hypothetical protein
MTWWWLPALLLWLLGVIGMFGLCWLFIELLVRIW